MKIESSVIYLSDSDTEECRTSDIFKATARRSPAACNHNTDHEEQSKVSEVEGGKQSDAQDRAGEIVKNRNEVEKETSRSTVEEGDTYDPRCKTRGEGSAGDEEDGDWREEHDPHEDSDSVQYDETDLDDDETFECRRKKNKTALSLVDTEEGRAFKYLGETYCYSADVFSLILEVPNAGADMKKALSLYRKNSEQQRYFGSSILNGRCCNVDDFKNFGTPDEESSAKSLMKKWFGKLHTSTYLRYLAKSRTGNSCNQRDVVAAMNKVRGTDVNYPEYMSNLMHVYLSKGLSLRVWGLCTAIMEFHKYHIAGLPVVQRALTRTRELADVSIFNGEGDWVGDADAEAKALVSDIAGGADAEITHRILGSEARTQEVVHRSAKSDSCQQDLDVNIMDVYEEVLVEMEAMHAQPRNVMSLLGNTDVSRRELAYGAVVFEGKTHVKEGAKECSPLLPSNRPDESRETLKAGKTPVKQVSRECSHGTPSNGADQSQDTLLLDTALSSTKKQVAVLLTSAMNDREECLQGAADLTMQIRDQEAAIQIYQRNLKRSQDELRDLIERGKNADRNIILLKNQQKCLTKSEQKRKLQEAENQEIAKEIDATAKWAKKLAVSFAKRD